MRTASIETPSGRILALLKTKGPQSAGQIARRMRVTAMAVRQHLYRLCKEAMVDFRDERRRIGRPARIWRLSERAAENFPDNHRELSIGILDAVRELHGENGLERLLAERTRQQTTQYCDRMPANSAPLSSKVAALAAIRTTQGYMAEWSRNRDGSFRLIENHCPVCSAAGNCPAVCREELALFGSLLGHETKIDREEHILSGARRCSYRISRRQ